MGARWVALALLALPLAAGAEPRSFCFSDPGTAQTVVHLSPQPQAGARWVYFSATPTAGATTIHLTGARAEAGISIDDPCEESSRRVHVTLEPAAGVRSVYVTPSPTAGATWYFMTPIAEGADFKVHVANPFLQRADVLAVVLRSLDD